MQTRSGGSDQVAADATAEVDDGRSGQSLADSQRAVLANSEPRGLLKPIRREVHPGSSGSSEFCDGPVSQRGLGDCGGHHSSVVPPAELLDQC
jgi:hypothetical protein